MIRNFKGILETAKQRGPMVISVAVAEDKHVLEAVWDAKQLGIADAYLVGDQEKIQSVAREIGMELSQFEIIHETNIEQAARGGIPGSVWKSTYSNEGLLDTPCYESCSRQEKRSRGTVY